MSLHAPGMIPLPPEDRTLPRMLEIQAGSHGDRTLVSCATDSWTFREARDIAAGRAATLRAAGVSAGDRVAILCSNRLEMLEIVLGCGWIGAIAVPINTAAMGPQIGYYLSNSGARLFAIEAQFVERLAHVPEGMASLGSIWVIGADAPPKGAAPLMEAMPPRAAPISAAPVSPGDTLAIIYTSGTTGPSKGVMCPHAQYYWWGIHSGRMFGLTADDVLCTTLPLFHINALNTFAQALLSGAHMVLEPRFSASGFWPAMIRNEATVIYLLGAMVPILLAGEPRADERGHKVRTGLGPGVPANLGATFAARTGVTLLEGYGSTETNFVIGASPETQKPGTMGRIIDGFQARVVDISDVELPDGEAGELVLRADEPFAFASGYFGMAEKTVEAWRNLWFHTGDRVIRDENGYFRFVDRLKDAIRRRGENISSYEVEQVLLAHPDIEMTAVFPVRSELAEDEVMAAIVVRPGAAIPPVELMQFCALRLPYFAVPRFIDFVADLPRTENGKIRKYELRERGVTASTWDREAAGYRLKRGAV
ncbi:ATP-dependent acyl-CoA ligase [Bradyrhizobium sp. AUGA SZCCT0182]|uniref:ATP-dependent acyl-CoA ligase n=1 Tax=Bradyrhizobium sp. AUGA SZCCT0182 TaxID=2807667 RepID=UPI001BA9E3D4|nr:ATP-dependent acyl-CoA ligase [Bradyrhizobium sp. AUGA SZCCT0182]MBR1234103.1 ATP-dependent acyl-CoA ligase [Bradyrhizobium sp. AUGA SZCCT0182]